MLRTVLSWVTGVAGAVVLVPGGVLAFLLLSGPGGSRSAGLGLVAALLVWTSLPFLGAWLSRPGEGGAAGLWLLGAVALVDVCLALFLPGAIAAAARP